MKGKRKRMRRAILAELDSPRPWLETVEMLMAKGIPENLIVNEANKYGKRKKSYSKHHER